MIYELNKTRDQNVSFAPLLFLSQPKDFFFTYTYQFIIKGIIKNGDEQHMERYIGQTPEGS